MKIRKTKKGNSIRRIVAFLLCMTMVLGLGMQDVMEQVYAEEGPAAVQQDVQDTENNGNGEQDAGPETPEETPSPTEEKDNVPDNTVPGNTPVAENESGSEVPSDSSVPGQSADGQGSGNGTEDGTAADTGSEENAGDTGNTEENTDQNNGNAADGAQGTETGNAGDGSGNDASVTDGTETPDGTEDLNGEGTPAEDDAQESEPTVPAGENGTEDGAQPTEDELLPEEVPFEDSYTDDKVTIQVSADAGVIPEGAKLSVTPIVKTEPEEIAGMSEEEKAEAEEINAQYELTEKKLTEDSEENGEILGGFLAYDISFLVTGEDGVTLSEVEPDGEVRVVMDFNEAVAPEDVPEDAEVTVKHLKEDETAEDGIVVEDVTEKATVTTAEAEAPAVEMVELTAESFSTYTITWGVKGEQRDTLTIKVVNAYGEALGYDSDELRSFEWENENTVTVDSIVRKIKQECNAVENEKFIKAVYSENGEFDYTATAIKAFKYKSTDNTYEFRFNPQGASEGKWDTVDENAVIYFIFGEEPEISTEPIETVSTKDTITINVFDYVVGSDGNESADWNSWSGINQSHVLKFVDEKGEWHQNINIHQEGSSGHINSGMVQLLLGDGFPALSRKGGNEELESLDYLFKPESEEDNARNSVRKQYLGLDHLFREGENGYLVFNSDEAYAYLKSEGSGRFEKDFTVIGYGGSSQKGFFPFTQPTADNLANLKESQKKAVLGHDGVNHYYGMTIEAGFIQPKGGVIDNVPMEFKFSGDDDVWVFIDDVLVLDLGGIHGAVSGTINFQTGEVTTRDIGETVEKHSTTIEDAFIAAGKDTSAEFSGDTFADYTSHTIKFFYLERGNTDSNCKIEFNFPTIPADSVTVAKEVVGEDGTGVDYAQDIDFRFQIQKAGEGETLAPFSNAVYKLFDGNGTEIINTDSSGEVIPWTADENGYFTLKHDQMAVFENFIATDHYKIIETGAYLDGYKVNIDGSEVKIDSEEGSEIIYSASTGDRVVGTDHDVTFRNKIEKTTQLTITKQVLEGVTSEGPFTIRLWIQGKPYVGDYQLNGAPGYETDNGEIDLKEDDTITITGLPYGVTFEVEEILEENSQYKPTYEITGDVAEVQIPGTGNTFTKASAQITGKDNDGAKVIIINDINPEYTIDIPVKKVWKGDPAFTENRDYVTVQLYQNGEAYGDPVRIESEDEWRYLFTNLPYQYWDSNEGKYVPYEYTVAELSIDDFEIDEYSWQVEITGNAQEGFVITNIWIPHWFIQKVSSTGKVPLAGAIFTLTSKSGETVYYGRSFEETEGYVIWWDTQEKMEEGDPDTRLKYIPDGEYTLREITAPSGYELSNVTWNIVINNLEFVKITDNEGKPVNPVEPDTRGLVRVNIYQYENQVELYELPSTGGPGIHLYMLGGTLLLMAGALLVYKKRKEEVLRS